MKVVTDWGHYAGGDDPQRLADPFPLFRQLRQEPGALYDADRDFWVLSRYDDVVAATRRPDVFSNCDGVGLRRAPGGRSLANLDPPGHTALRRTAAPGFSRARAAVRAADLARVADDLLAAYDGDGEADITETVIEPYAARSLCGYLGLPDADVAELAGFAAAASRVNGDVGTPEDLQLCGAFAELAGRRLRDDRETLGHGALAATIEPGGPVDTDPEQALHHLLSVVIGGYETPRHFLAGALHVLASDPARWAWLRRAQRPQLAAGVEELLRYVSPIVGAFRSTAVDHQLDEAGETTLPAGTRVLLLYGSANHDDGRYDEADELVLNRFAARPPDHLGFGSGPHYCLGAHFARLVATQFLATAARRWRTATVRTAPSWQASFLTRGLSGLSLGVT